MQVSSQSIFNLNNICSSLDSFISQQMSSFIAKANPATRGLVTFKKKNHGIRFFKHSDWLLKNFLQLIVELKIYRLHLDSGINRSKQKGRSRFDIHRSKASIDHQGLS